MADRLVTGIKQTVADEASQVKQLTGEALKSGAYVYPFLVQGIKSQYPSVSCLPITRFPSLMFQSTLI
jgi:hypothetical protein